MYDGLAIFMLWVTMLAFGATTLAFYMDARKKYPVVERDEWQQLRDAIEPGWDTHWKR